MLTTGLSKNTQSNLALLGNQDWTTPFYLAGGFDPKLLTQKLKALGQLTIDQDDQNTFLGKLNSIKISFFLYPYPLLFKPKIHQNIAVADLRDIACMKIDAISSRGTKRDFIDLFFICKQYPLLDLFTLFGKKYKGVNYNLNHIIKSITYFVNAEEQESPKMIEKVSWEEVKVFFENEVKQISKKLIGIS